MILSDREIRAAVVRGAVALDPFPPTAAWSSTAVDLRLADEISIWRTPLAGNPVSPSDPKYNFTELQLEIWNVGPLDILLVSGMPICQLIFEWVDGTPDKGYDGRFAVQGPPQKS